VCRYIDKGVYGYMYIYSFNAFIVQEDEWSITQAMQIQIYKYMVDR